MSKVNEPIEIEKRDGLIKELIELRKYLNYKNSSFCKSKLDKIIEKYFGECFESIRKKNKPFERK